MLEAVTYKKELILSIFMNEGHGGDLWTDQVCPKEKQGTCAEVSTTAHP